MRQRMNAKVQVQEKENTINITLTHSLDKTLYNLPLTLKSYVPKDWKEVLTKQGTKEQRVQAQQDDNGMFVLYQAMPNAGAVELSAGK
jgi:hypothetical protein